MWTMFIAVCLYGQCSWLEVESPVFERVDQCEIHSRVVRHRLLGEISDRSVTVFTECIPQTLLEQFRQDQLKSHRLSISTR